MAKNLGKVTAYAHAKAGGYTGTEAEFNAMLAGLDEYNEAAAQSAEEASGYAEEASGYVTEASGYADNASASASAALEILGRLHGSERARYWKHYDVTTQTTNFAFNPTNYSYTTGDDYDVYVNGEMLDRDKVMIHTTSYEGGYNVAIIIDGGISGAGNPDKVDIFCYKDITLSTDDTLTEQGAAADAKKTGDEINALKDDLYEGGGETETELTFITGKYINTGGSGVNIGDTIDINNPGTYANLRYAIANCVAGDRFRLDGIHGALSGRAWAFLTSANVLISRADANIAVTGYITAPENAGKVVINDNFQSVETYGKAYKVEGSQPVLVLDSMVRFDKAQDLTAEQKEQVKENIGVSDDLARLQEEIDSFSGGLTSEIKQALLNCFAHVGWDHDTDRTYYNALEEALYADEIKSISAVFTPGTHEVYTTDNVESLRNFLVVTVTYNDDTQAIITDYILEGSIANIGTKTITVKYGRKTTTFTVNVVANSTGILYEWDFTKSLTDFRQCKTSEPVCYYASHLPTVNTNGVNFDGGGQGISLFGTDTPVSFFSDKTIQIDVSSFSPKDNSHHVRLLTFMNPKASNLYNAGIVFRAFDRVGWSSYAGTAWGQTFTGMTNRTDISGHTIGIYIPSTLSPIMYVDGVSKGNVLYAYDSDLSGLMLGNNDLDTNGATLYDAVVTGVRVYNGRME